MIVIIILWISFPSAARLLLNFTLNVMIHPSNPVFDIVYMQFIECNNWYLQRKCFEIIILTFRKNSY